MVGGSCPSKGGQDQCVLPSVGSKSTVCPNLFAWRTRQACSLEPINQIMILERMKAMVVFRGLPLNSGS